MKLRKVLLQATSLFVVLVITLYFGYGRVHGAEIQGKASRIIKKIEIRGNQRISTAAIRNSIREIGRAHV